MYSLFRAYNSILHKHPLSITSLTTGACYGAGDYLAQKVEMKQGKRTEIDKHRLAVFTLFGTFLGGPIYYAWFNKIDKMPLLVERIVKWNQQRYITNEFGKQLHHHIKKNSIDAISMKDFRVQLKSNFEMIEKHGLFQAYYFFHFLGMDRNLRDQFKGQPLYERTLEFCEKYDAPAFDKNYDTLPLSFFEPMLRRLMANPINTIYTMSQN